MSDLSRPLIFVGLFSLFILLQRLVPFNKDQETLKRAVQNLSHAILSQVIIFSIFYLLGSSFFVLSENMQIGLFYKTFFPELVKLGLTFLVFDLALYWQHRVSHRWKWFWSIHKMHHSDEALTTSTAVRFHFFEILISAVWKGVLIILLGASLADYVLFEVFLSSCALFNHTNLKIPQKLNKALEAFLVTPEIHRVHHSVDLKLCHSNFGFSVVFWDKLFGSFSRSQNIQEVGVKGLKWDSFKKQLLLGD